jgi:hypothetical protein
VNIPIKVQWDKVEEADLYAVYVQPEGGDWTTLTTVEPAITIQVPLRKHVTLHVNSRKGPLESIDSESMQVYATRW